jgi:hypothetical protein
MNLNRITLVSNFALPDNRQDLIQGKSKQVTVDSSCSRRIKFPKKGQIIPRCVISHFVLQGIIFMQKRMHLTAFMNEFSSSFYSNLPDQ